MFRRIATIFSMSALVMLIALSCVAPTTVCGSTPAQVDLATVASQQVVRNKLAESTVKIHSMNAITGRGGTGTGVSIEFEGDGSRVLTAGHICKVNHPKLLLVKLDTIKGASAVGKIILISDSSDLCMIETVWVIPRFPIANSYVANFGDKILTVQAPLGIFPVIREGIMNFMINDTYILSLVSTGGASGSPVIYGSELVGIITEIASTRSGNEWSGISVAESLGEIKRFLIAVRLKEALLLPKTKVIPEERLAP